MKLESKLKIVPYPCVVPSEIPKYVTCDRGIDLSAIDPVLLGRLAALARDYKQKINISSGYRSIESQAKIFLSRGGKHDPKVGYFWPAGFPAEKKTVAKPGSSFHNYHIAVDSNSPWFKAINKVEAIPKQAILLKYGLMKPMTVGQGSKVLEDWHVQPIETKDVPLAKRSALAPKIISM